MLYVEGRQYPVDVFYTIEPQADYLDAALITVLQIHLEQPEGDILVFLTGREEIETMEKLLNEKSQFLPEGSLKVIQKKKVLRTEIEMNSS